MSSLRSVHVNKAQLIVVLVEGVAEKFFKERYAKVAINLRI